MDNAVVLRDMVRSRLVAQEQLAAFYRDAVTKGAGVVNLAFAQFIDAHCADLRSVLEMVEPLCTVEVE